MDKSLALIDRAIDADKVGARRGRLLSLRAKTLEELGRYEEAVATLRSVLPSIDGTREPRLLLVVRLNLAEVLQRLGRNAEVEEMLPGVRALTVQLGNQLDLIRLRWVEGRLAAGHGRLAEAEAVFQEVFEAFMARGIAFDAALVLLELALLHAEQGKTQKVQELSERLVKMFQAQRVQREILATWKIFCEAVAKEAITAELLRDLFAELRQAGTI